MKTSSCFYFLVLIFIYLKTINGQECKPSTTKSSRFRGRICKGALIFVDHFDSLNLSRWQHEVSMINDPIIGFQLFWHKGENSKVSDGLLTITPGKLADIFGNAFLTSGTLDLGKACTAWRKDCIKFGTATKILPPITSASLNTYKSFSFTYGRVEVRAKMPAGDWLWPAIWLAPYKNNYGIWPASGMFKMMELRGNRNLTINGISLGVEQAISNLHWGPSPEHNKLLKTWWQHNLPQGEGWDKDFHNYQLLWTPDYIRISIDNKAIGDVRPPADGFWELGNLSSSGLPNPWINGTKMAPFDQEFFLILSLNVGSTSGYFPEHAVNKPVAKPWLNSSPQPFLDFWNARANQWNPTWKSDGSTQMKVDYVKVWAL